MVSFIGTTLLVIVCVIIGILVLGKIIGLIFAIISDCAGLVFALIVFGFLVFFISR